MPSYWYYLVVRALLSVGESSFSVIAPTIIGDLFTAEQRSLAYGLFYIAIPFGTGLGFGVGGFPEDWRWGLRITPILSFCYIIFVILFLSDPPRGESDGQITENKSFGFSGFLDDLKYIASKSRVIYVTLKHQYFDSIPRCSIIRPQCWRLYLRHIPDRLSGVLRPGLLHQCN